MIKKNAYLKDENLLSLFSLNSLIVPEIQREYVWGNNEEVIKGFLQDIKNYGEPCPSCHHIHSDKIINVGFLYSYKPPYTEYEKDRMLEEYIIDGQQRITTLFLLLLSRSVTENRVKDFLSITRWDDDFIEPGFSYKVRDLTCKFMRDLIHHITEKGVKSLDFITDDKQYPAWFLEDYKKDTTVCSMCNALKIISQVFNEETDHYYDFILHNIHFLHFKTDITSQGEELYITMNSRGEALTVNEMKKAFYLPDEQLEGWGKKWEEWQTFFWYNRKKGNPNNVNSDIGFNSFLACIEGLEIFQNQSSASNLKIDKIEKYITALQFIMGDEIKDKLDELYPGTCYKDWFENFKAEIWETLNKGEISWNIPNPRKQGDTDAYNNASTARNKTILFWSWMIYSIYINNNLNNLDLISISKFIRFLHFFYIRYKMFKRSTTTIEQITRIIIEDCNERMLFDDTQNAESQEDDDSQKLLSREEILISSILEKDPEHQNENEALIWYIQDLRYFNDGRNVGGETIYNYFKKEHDILDYNNITSSLHKISSCLTSILPENNKDEKSSLLKSNLIFYDINMSSLFNRRTPYYYYNYETSEWKRIIRTEAFIKLFEAVLSLQSCATTNNIIDNLKSKLEQNRRDFFMCPENQSFSYAPLSDLIAIAELRKITIVYDCLCDNGIWGWDKCFNIVFLDNNDESIIKLFKNQPTIWRINRDLRGQCEKIELPNDWQSKLGGKYPELTFKFNGYNTENTDTVKQFEPLP